ncbi:hypothetical protein VRRI112168_00705 [Vreelandella rituensis]
MNRLLCGAGFFRIEYIIFYPYVAGVIRYTSDIHVLG